jgi:hypothetical protein
MSFDSQCGRRLELPQRTSSFLPKAHGEKNKDHLPSPRFGAHHQQLHQSTFSHQTGDLPRKNIETATSTSRFPAQSPAMVKLGLAKPEGDAGKSLNAIIIGMFVAFGGVLFGFVFSPVPRSLSPALTG